MCIPGHSRNSEFIMIYCRVVIVSSGTHHTCTQSGCLLHTPVTQVLIHATQVLLGCDTATQTMQMFRLAGKSLSIFACRHSGRGLAAPSASSAVAEEATQHCHPARRPCATQQRSSVCVCARSASRHVHLRSGRLSARPTSDLDYSELQSLFFCARLTSVVQQRILPAKCSQLRCTRHQ